VLVDVPQHDEDDKNDVGLVRNEMPDVHANQFRALALKTLSYEKHTCCTTCCCVFMCPFLMVLLCGILSVVVKVLLQHISPDMDVQFCSNVSASDPFTNIPLANAPQDSTGRYFFNFDQSTTVSNACVNWFGEDYPYSLPYSPELIDTDNCSTYTFYNPDICPYETTYARASSVGFTDRAPVCFRLGRSSQHPPHRGRQRLARRLQPKTIPSSGPRSSRTASASRTTSGAGT